MWKERTLYLLTLLNFLWSLAKCNLNRYLTPQLCCNDPSTQHRVQCDPVSRFVSYAACWGAAPAMSHLSQNWFPNGKMIKWLHGHHFLISSPEKVLQYNILFWGQCFLISFRMLAWLWLVTGSTLICPARDIQTNLLPYFRLSMKNWIMNTAPSARAVLLHQVQSSEGRMARLDTDIWRQSQTSKWSPRPTLFYRARDKARRQWR